MVLGVEDKIGATIHGPVPSMEITLGARVVDVLKGDLYIGDVMMRGGVGLDQGVDQRLDISAPLRPGIAAEADSPVLVKDLDLFVDAVLVDPLGVPVQAVGDRLAIIYLLESVIMHSRMLARMDLQSRADSRGSLKYSTGLKPLTNGLLGR